MAWIAVVLIAYIAFVLFRLGVHQRMPLALSRISLDRIPDRSEAAYGDAPLFTTDEAAGWGLPGRASTGSDHLQWSAARIRRTADHVAAMLQQRAGIECEDRVVLFKRNHLDMHVLAAAVVRAGGIACPVNNQFAAEPLAEYIDNTGATIMFADPASLHRVFSQRGSFGSIDTVVITAVRDDDATALEETLRRRRIHNILWIEDALQKTDPGSFTAAPRAGDDILYLVHSSGTTGVPKAVALRNCAQSHAVRGWLSYVHLSRTFDRALVAVPDNHQAVMLTFHSALLLGLPVHWTGAYSRDGFDAERVVRALADGGYTGYFGFPITYTQMKEVALEKYDLSRMRFWATTADASHETIQRRFAKFGGAFRSVGIPVSGAVFLDAQGSSEVGTPSVIRYVTRFTRRFDRRVGRPGSTPFGPAVRITDNNGSEVLPGDVGRLEVHGKTVFAGYWNNDALTQRAFNAGWFFTGDVARQSSDGNIIQLDREVDVIHTNTGPVYSLPMEEIIHRHRAVFDCCVFGARQSDGTQLPAVAVAPRRDIVMTADELRAALNAMLPASAQLSDVVIMEWSDFPVGVTGKTLKRVFRDWSVYAVAEP